MAALLAPMYAPVRGVWPALVIAAAGLALVLRAGVLFKAVDVRAFKVRFMEINSFALLVMVMLVVDRLG